MQRLFTGMSSRSSQRSNVSPSRSRKGLSSPSSPSSPSSSFSATDAKWTPFARKQGRTRSATPPSVHSYLSRRSSTSSSRPYSVLPVSPTGGIDRANFGKTKESVSVTVRFRPLSAREINKGDEIAWYADGDHIVRNEYNPNIAYGFDRVFGPATTTRQVYDVAAQNVVSGAMEGINGTVFAYGVTSSGKTHTMHGEQKSPGVIPLAVKDVFNIIQETPGRVFLLRVSYLEIYNEVINDLLDPTGQNLKIREDLQGTYVEGIKEEVVLSSAHALSLIASGEEHRHVGCNNFNLLSSRSHTIFTMTIESSSEENQGEDVALSQLNLIDLAGSESSKTETTGLRRKEGSYINKSLLTLGTVIAKLTDGKSAHVPYRDSKLTRLLQSSLSGHGRVSIICTITPASSNTEETHNTIKFAHRSKHVEIKAAQNKILDEKSLIKKYQKEIASLKNELQHLKRGMMEKQYFVTPDQEDLVNLKMQLEAGQVKLQSRLEEEEQAKAALMGRIQRLTKLILVSTKNTVSSDIPERANYRRTHSFCEDELAFLPDTKREYVIDDDIESLDSELSSDESSQFEKRNKKPGMLGWFKTKNCNVDHDSSANVSPSCPQSSQRNFFASDVKLCRRKSISKRGDDPSSGVDSFPGRSQAGDLFSAAVRSQRPLPTGTTITDQMDLLREQVKMLAGEVALCTSSEKRLTEQAAKNPDDLEIQVQMQRLKDEISEKRSQMHKLEQRMIGSFERSQCESNNLEMSQALSKMAGQLNEKTFELEIMSADNRILQEQLQLKISENKEIQETAILLRQQIDLLKRTVNDIKQTNMVDVGQIDLEDEACFSGTPSKSLYNQSSLKSQVLMQASEIVNLKQENLRLAEEKEGFEIHSKRLSEEASYAKELASAAAIELKNLAEEVTKLSYHNAKLMAEASLEPKILEKDKRMAELQSMIEKSKQREEDLENKLANMEALVAKMKIPERSELTVYEGVSSHLHSNDQNGSDSCNGLCSQNCKDHFYTNKNRDGITIVQELQTAYESEKKRSEELERTISKLKSEDLSGLDFVSLDELQNFHANALSKIRLTKLMIGVL